VAWRGGGAYQKIVAENIVTPRRAAYAQAQRITLALIAAHRAWHHPALLYPLAQMARQRRRASLRNITSRRLASSLSRTGALALSRHNAT